MMRDRQWIRVQLPDIKSLSIPIKISQTPLATHLANHGKDLLEDLSDDDETKEEEEEEGTPSKKKRKTVSIDPVDVFLINPEPIKKHSLDTNSSTLALSNAHILIQDKHRLILFDYQKQISELQWNDNEYGSFYFLFLPFTFILFISRYSGGHMLDTFTIGLCRSYNSLSVSIRSIEANIKPTCESGCCATIRSNTRSSIYLSI